MSASLFISAASIGTDGKTLTATVSGVSGSLSPASSVTGLTVYFNGYAVALAAVTTSGSTLTAKLLQPTNPLVTITADLATSGTSNLTDTGGNTPTGQTGLSVTNASTQNIRQVADHCMWPNQDRSNGTDTACNFRWAFSFKVDATSIRAVFVNAYNSESATGNTNTITAGLEYPLGTTTPFTFNGASSVSAASGAMVVTDPLTVSATAASAGAIRGHYIVPSGGKWPIGPAYSAANCGYEHGTSGASQTDKSTLTGALTANAFEFGPAPVAVLGTPTASSSASITIYGDSIAAGAADTATTLPQGYIQKAIDTAFAWTSAAVPGETMATMSASTGKIRRSLAQYYTHAVVEYGINDFGGNPGSPAGMQANSLLTWNAIKASGPSKVYQTTITPYTSSTDSFATTTNQTVANPAVASGGARTLYNDWLRDGAPIVSGVAVATGTPVADRAGDPAHPLAGYFEVADVTESASNSGKWAVTGAANYATGDGLHPSAAMHTLLINAIDTDALSEFVIISPLTLTRGATGQSLTMTAEGFTWTPATSPITVSAGTITAQTVAGDGTTVAITYDCPTSAGNVTFSDALSGSTALVFVGDSIAPNPPTDLAGTTTYVANLSWSAPSVETGDGPYTYHVYRDGVLLTSASGQSGTTFVDSAVASGTYAYTVKTRDASGNLSVAASATFVAGSIIVIDD